MDNTYSVMISNIIPRLSGMNIEAKTEVNEANY